MFIDVRNLQERRARRDSQFEGVRDIRNGYLFEVNGSVAGDRDGLVWFKAIDDNSEPFQVFYNGIIGDLRPNMFVKIERKPKDPSRWAVIEFDTGAYFDDQSTYEQLPSLSAIPAKEDYEWPPGFPGSKALNIFPRAVTDFAVRPTSPASMKARVYSGIYPGATNYARFQGPVNTKDFTADVPGAGLARLVAISIDNTGTLNYTNGTTFVDGLPMPDASLPAVPASQMLISAVRLVNGMTAIEESNFDLEMRPLMANGTVNLKVNEVWRDDFSEVAIFTNDDGGVGINTATIPHGAVGTAQLAIDGGTTGFTTPAIQITTSADDYPLYQIWPYSHDEIWLLFDCYAVGWGLNPPALFNSSDAGSNFAIVKRDDTLSIRYNAGSAQGVNFGGFSAGVPTGWDDAITVTETGWTGIGTDTPRSKVDILDTSAEQLRLTFQDNFKFTKFEVDTNHDLTITPSVSGQVIFQPTTDSTGFFQVLDADGGTPVLNVDSTNEHVGIGTATPDYLLQVGDGSPAITLSTTKNIIFIGSDETVGRLVVEGSGQADIILIDGGWPTADDKAMQLVTQSGLTKFRSLTDAAGIQTDNVLSMDHSNGNVGIGTTPDSSVRLHVVKAGFVPSRLENQTTGTSAAAATLDLLLNGPAINMADGFGPSLNFAIQDDAAVRNPIARISGIRDGADNSGELNFDTASAGSITTKMAVKNDGKVGIGTVNPGTELTISAAVPRLLFVDESSADTGLSISVDASKLSVESRDDDGTFNATLVTVERSGNVGMGTVSPSAQLHVDQASTTAAEPVLYLDQADISEEMIEFNTTIGVGNAIEAVGAKTLTTTHFIKVTLPGALTRYIPVGTIA